MNKCKCALARIYQLGIYIGTIIVHMHEPKVVKGENAALKIKDILISHNIADTLLVVDDGLFNVPFTTDILNALIKGGINTKVFHNFRANPTIANVEEGVKIFKDNNLHSIIGLGGGSSMDTAKMIAARATNPKKSIAQMKGLLHVRHKLPLLIAVPTTAGTGSETTAAAIIIDENTHHKYPIEDPKLVPMYAVLDPTLLVKLPAQVTSTTGMDALTHALEAFINKFQTPRTSKNALEAIKLIYENLYLSYTNPDNLVARSNMQLASYKAGVAFTNAYVGYVHAIAHALGGQYNIAHGLANVLILPIVLKKYDKKIYKRIAKIYDYINMGSTTIKPKEKCECFINWIYEMKQKMQIQYNLNELIKESDIPTMVNHSYAEGYPLYPCPKMFDRHELTDLYYQIKEENK